MGVKVEFNPELALRDISEHKDGNRKLEECIPEPLEKGKVYDFLKKEQRIYWLEGEVPLIETRGGIFSKPKASVIILEAMHFLDNNEIYTKGKYRVVEVFTDENLIYFEGCDRVKGIRKE